MNTREMPLPPSVTPKHRRFEELILPHQKVLKSYAYLLTRNVTEAEDLVQETLVRAYEHLEGITSVNGVRGWLYVMLRHLYCNRWRRRKLCVSESGESLEIAASPVLLEAEYLQKVRREALMTALKKLPVEYREPLRRFGIEGQSYQQIADQLDLPLGTIRSRINRGRQRLRRTLSDW